MNASDVIGGERNWSVEQADCLNWLRSLPADSINLVMTSPPYELARTYLESGKNMNIARKPEAWVAWLIDVIRECSRVCTGLIAFVVEGQTKNYRYSAGPFLLAADLHRAGFNLRKPPAFCRVGIPGSGGPDWLRNDYELIICITRHGKLPWSDNTACGHPPKWAPGGQMSNRNADGRRINAQPSKQPKMFAKDGDDEPTLIDYHERPQGMATCGRSDDIKSKKGYEPPSKANPGNLIKCVVGCGLMGHPLAHENEAPYPLALAEFFVRSFCRPGGIVCDPFSGSGTTGHAAILHGRRYVGCDLRDSQVELTSRRCSSVTPVIPGMADA